ncbi:hypothetical protein D3C72_2337310 [compost metagenome]
MLFFWNKTCKLQASANCRTKRTGNKKRHNDIRPAEKPTQQRKQLDISHSHTAKQCKQQKNAPSAQRTK